MASSVGGATHYEVGQPLDAGGMGVVYYGAMVTAAGRRQVALKRVLGGTDATPVATDRLIAEAQLVFQLTHANICQVIDLALAEDGAYIVFEFVDGPNLRSLVEGRWAARETTEIALCVFVAREIAAALDYAHRRRDGDNRLLYLIHGDVTPQNVLLSREGEVKLADFGIARALGTVAPGNSVRGGTPGYVAPEVESGKSDQRADLYGLGATLFFSLTGTPPDDVSQVGERLRELRADAPSDLCALLDRILAHDPDERFATAAEVEEALTGVLARHFPRFTRKSLASALTRSPRRPAASSNSNGGAIPQFRSATHAQSVIVTEQPLRAPTQRVTKTFRSSAIWSVTAAVAVAIAALVVWRGLDEPEPVVALEAPLAPNAALPPTNSVPPQMNTAPKAAVVPAPVESPSAPSAAQKVTKRESVEKKAEKGYVNVHSVPWGAVYVDGVRVAEETPAYKLSLSRGRHEITIYSAQRGGFSPPRRIEILPERTQDVSIKW